MRIHRNSPQRDAVLRAVCDSSDHPTAETLYERVRGVFPNISLGTVYRNLSQLCEAGKMRRVAVSGGSCRFDKTLAPHAHFYCRMCQSVTDIGNEVAAAIEDRVETATGHDVEKLEMLFTGVCADCLRRLPSGRAKVAAVPRPDIQKEDNHGE